MDVNHIVGNLSTWREPIVDEDIFYLCVWSYIMEKFVKLDLKNDNYILVYMVGQLYFAAHFWYYLSMSKVGLKRMVFINLHNHTSLGTDTLILWHEVIYSKCPN